MSVYNYSLVQIKDDKIHPERNDTEVTHSKQIRISEENRLVEVLEFEREWLVHKVYSKKAMRYAEEDKKLVNEKIIESHGYHLKEVSAEELKEIRMSKVPGFVLKTRDGKYLYSEVSPEISFFTNSNIGTHMCSSGNSGGCCLHLSAASDARGGCAKVRHLSKGIERFPFIEYGYETFNTQLDCFVVLTCSRFEGENILNRHNLTTQQIKQLKHSLYDLYFDG